MLIKLQSFARIAVVLLILPVQCAHAGLDTTDAFIADVNQAWCSSNYTSLKEIIDLRLENQPDDLLALGLRFVYHDSIIVDFYNARNAAQAYIVAVSNRMPSEVIHWRVPLNFALNLLQMPVPTNFPSSQLKTTAQMEAMHDEFAEEFPYLMFYREVPNRIQQIEKGTITDDDLDFLNRPPSTGP